MRDSREKKQPVSADLSDNRRFLEDEIGLDISFDLVAKEFKIADRDALLVGVDGFIKDRILLFIVQTLSSVGRSELLPGPMQKIFERFVGYVECELMDDMYDAADQILSGPAVLLVDGEKQVLAIDSRTYPGRGVDEPNLERVMRGPRDGFVETLVMNLALLRRRVRDRSLRAVYENAGRRSQTDIAIIYLEDIANPETVDRVKEDVKNIELDGLPMAERTVAEALTGWHSNLNPFPVVRYTERPDVAAVYLFEGHVLVIVDGSPAAIMLPVTLFHHLQHAEEFHESVINGSFVRGARYLAFLAAWLGTPLWLLLATNRQIVPAALSFIGPKEVGVISLPVQFLLAELGLEFVRVGLILTPNALATSLGIIGTVLLGDLAVQVGLFAPETILYVTVAGLAYFSLPSWELGEAVRLMRIGFLVMTGFFGLAGFSVALILSMVLLVTTKSWDVPYLWPLIPFNWSGMKDVLFRRPTSEPGRRPVVLKPGDSWRSPHGPGGC